MEKINELKSRIYKHNPLLLELSCGCELKPKEKFEFPQYTYSDKFVFINEVGGGQIADTGDYDEYTAHLIETETKEVYTQDIDIRQDFQILGHPIHLEHVLRAIGGEPKNFFYYSSDGFRIDFLRENYKSKEIWYDLTKTFDQNCENEELVDFLLEVIKNELKQNE